MNSVLKTRLISWFEDRFGEGPQLLVRAPGRVNLIGEHTDYNQGWVMPLAIDRAVWIALRPRPDRRVRVFSVAFSEMLDFSLERLRREGPVWGEYIKGVAWAMKHRGQALAGWEGVLDGDVPIGAGLSSSAALETAAVKAFAEVGGLKLTGADLAEIGRRAENDWVGVSCGVMDQMISAGGVAGHALLIDCRSLSAEVVPLPAGFTVMVLDTATRRGLMDSAYNQRRSECQAAADFFKVPSLRDLALKDFESRTDPPEEHLRRRVRHVLSENERTLDAAEAMRRGEAETLGRLMTASHQSLKDDFEVSTPALNVMVEAAMSLPGCLGARLTGAGFGGCAVALVRQEECARFQKEVVFLYEKATGLKPAVHACQAADGVQAFGLA
ncbi:MAG: galactokinase [Thermodesulfobacteriota bacterium]